MEKWAVAATLLATMALLLSCGSKTPLPGSGASASSWFHRYRRPGEYPRCGHGVPAARLRSVALAFGAGPYDRWRHRHRAVFAPDGRMFVILGERCFCLSAEGKTLWSYRMPAQASGYRLMTFPIRTVIASPEGGCYLSVGHLWWHSVTTAKSYGAWTDRKSVLDGRNSKPGHRPPGRWLQRHQRDRPGGASGMEGQSRRMAYNGPSCDVRDPEISTARWTRNPVGAPAPAINHYRSGQD